MSPIATHLKVLRKIHSLNLELAIPILARPEAGEPQGPSCLYLPHSLTLVLGLWMCAEPRYFMSAGDTNSDSHAHAATTLPTEPSPGSKATMWKKDGMTHIWRSTLTNRLWTDKRSNRLWDFPLHITLGAGLQSCTQTSRGPLPTSAPSRTWVDSITSNFPGFTAERIKFWDLTPESLFTAWMEPRLLRVTGPG